MTRETLDLDRVAARPWDAVVIGAGPAGALAARQAAAGGLRVLLVDRKPFPRPKVCGGCLGGKALAVLESAGLGGLVDRLGGIDLGWLELRLGGRTARIGLPGGKALARDVFDAALVEEAVAAGAEFLPATAATRRARRRVRAGRAARSPGPGQFGPGPRRRGGRGPGRVVPRAGAGARDADAGRGRVAAGGRLHGGGVSRRLRTGDDPHGGRPLGLRRARPDAGRPAERRRGLRPGLRPRPGAGRRRPPPPCSTRPVRRPCRPWPARPGRGPSRLTRRTRPVAGHRLFLHRRRGRLRRAVHRRGHGRGTDLGPGGRPADRAGLRHGMPRSRPSGPGCTAGWSAALSSSAAA